MSRHLWPAAGALLAAAVVACLPTGGARRSDVLQATSGGSRVRRAAPAALGRSWRRLQAAPPTLVAAGAGVLGLIAGGPVAAFVATAYAGAATRGLHRHRLAARHARERVEALDGLCALAADLRAGLPPLMAHFDGSGQSNGRPGTASHGRRWADADDRPANAPGTRPAAQAQRLWDLAAAATRLAEQTGAPLADLVERIEADARTTDRAITAAAAQAAGARATAWLLAGLPLGGIALGFAVGVDPLHVLLRTPTGAACAVAAVLLQLGGLAWADLLARPATGAL